MTPETLQCGAGIDSRDTDVIATSGNCGSDICAQVGVSFFEAFLAVLAGGIATNRMKQAIRINALSTVSPHVC